MMKSIQIILQQWKKDFKYLKKIYFSINFNVLTFMIQKILLYNGVKLFLSEKDLILLYCHTENNSKFIYKSNLV